MFYDKDEIKSLAPWLLIVITLIGGVLRVFMIGNKGLRLDESFSIWLSSQSVADILHWVVKIDQHPPLYYLLLHGWIARQGDALGSVRLLSALFGTATIPVIYLIGKRMSGVATGLAAAVILALSPFNIRFAQETRMYTCLAFNAAVAIYALVRLLTDSRSARPIGSQFREYVHAWRTSRQPEPEVERDFSYANKVRTQTGWRAWIFRHRWLPVQAVETDLAWVAFIVFSAAAMLSHNAAVLFPLAANIFVLGLILLGRTHKSGSDPAFSAPSFSNWVKAQIGIFLLWSPWLYGFIEQAGRVYQWSWIPTPGWSTVIQVFKSFLSDFTSDQASLAKVIWILYALVLCLGLVHYHRKMPRFLFLTALIVIPFLGELIVSIHRPVFLDRTLIWTTIPLFLMLAAGIVQSRFRGVMLVLLGILGANNLFSASDYYRSMQQEDWNNVAGYVANYVQKGDLILFNAAWVQIPFDYYFRVYEDQYSLQVEQHGVPADMFDRGIPEAKMADSDIPGLISLLSGRNRVWLVYSHDWYADTDPMRLIPQTLASKMKLIQQRDFYGLQVQLYQAPY